MSKKKPTEKKQKKPKVKAVSEDYEVAQFGPLRLERSGRFVRLSSHWEPGEFEKHIELLRANREPFRDEINSKIKELVALFEQYSPIELLSALAPKHVFADPETFTESTHEGKESYVEYALSIALSVTNPKLDVPADKDAIDRVNALIEEIFDSITLYFGHVVLDEEDRTKQELRYKSLLRYLMQRGDSYPAHHIDLIKELFEPHDKFLIDAYGFDTKQVLSWIDEIENQIASAMSSFVEFSQKLFELHEAFVRFTESEGSRASESTEELLINYNELPEVQIKKKELEESQDKLQRFIFEVKPNSKLPQTFLDVLSAKFGDNQAFVSFEKSPGWPTNDSIITRRPLISHENSYYCFASQIIYRNLITILEALIKEKDSDYFSAKYQKARAKILVEKALEFFERLLPGSQIYKELFYYIEEDGQRKRAETDGIVVFDRNLFIIEGKAGSFSAPARRGALPRIKSDVTSLVDDAYKQALRTRRFISEVDTPVFEFENGTPALTITDKTFTNVFLVNVTLENLGYLATQLNSLKNLSLIDGKEWPWSVFLNDLRVISEILESPSEFLLYLKRRLRANDYPQFQSPDELDFLMYFLRDGLYLEENWIESYGIFSLHAYTEDLDRYYSYQAGTVASGEKPRLQIPEEYKTLVRGIEDTGKIGFSEVSTTLLSFSKETMEEILTKIEWAKNTSLSDGKDHHFTLTFPALDLGVTISVSTSGKDEQIRSLKNYCSLKMYQLKLSKWLLLGIDVTGLQVRFDFDVSHKRWVHNSQMENALDAFRRNKLKQFFASGNKVGRNDLCPCNSGLKYKKCCLIRY